MDWAEFVIAVTKNDGVGRPVWAHGIKSKNDLSAVLLPAATLGRCVFPDVQGSKSRGAVRSQGKSEDPLRWIRRRRMPLIGAWEIRSFSHRNYRRGGARDEAAEPKQITRNQATSKHDE
jgi:hypothetical protein